MFFLTYLHRELRRRFGRTLLTVTGFALAVGLVVVVSALSTGLDRSQAKILDPLQSVGTDLMVSRPVEVPLAGAARGGQAAVTDSGQSGSAIVGGVPTSEVDKLVDENQQLFETDFSKLGKAGSTFEREIWLPATQLTFDQAESARIAKLSGVGHVSGGLSLLAVHQKGKVPEVVAQVQTGGKTYDVTQKVAPPTASEWAAIESCVNRTGGSGNCLPGRFQQLKTQFTTPREIIRQVLDPPQTDVATEPYTAAGVDTRPGGLGLITPAQIVEGTFFSPFRAAPPSVAQPAAVPPTAAPPTSAPRTTAPRTTAPPTTAPPATVAPSATRPAPAPTGEVVLAQGYARRKHLAVGSTIVLNQMPYRVVGLARPPLGGQSADVYLPVDELQRIAGRTARLNLLFVRADRAADVSGLARRIERSFPGSQVTSAKDLAARISGSLVDASNLANRLGLALIVIALAAAFSIASLLTLSSVTKRVRELGTLRAVGWRRRLVVRQVIAESLAQGLIGAVTGILLGIGAAAAVSAIAPKLHASAAVQAGPLTSGFGLGAVLADKASQVVKLNAPVSVSMLALAAMLALVGGLLAGLAGAVRTAQLRPADALRELG